MKRIFLFIILFFTCTLVTEAQQQLQLTQNAQISVITVDPGSGLVDSFGHSAFRVRDPFLSVDHVYNYGTYDFNTPNFLAKFAQGKLLYILSIRRFDRFLEDYTLQNRTVVEQILNLTAEEKQRFFEFLQNNARPENRSYLYDFFFDNCATKLHDVSKKILPNQLKFNYTFNETDLTFRDLIHNYLDNQAWGKFGIDLALGSVIDRKATPQEYLFLPDYIFKSFEKGSIAEKPLVRTERTLFAASPTKNSTLFFTPFIVFLCLAVCIAIMTYRNLKTQSRSKWLDFALFFFTGIVGLLVLLLWFATDHSATQKNYNFLWAFLPNLPLAFLFLKKELKPWLENYLMLLVALLLVTILIWLLKIQIFSIAVLPILCLLSIRYVYLIHHIKRRKS